MTDKPEPPKEIKPTEVEEPLTRTGLKPEEIPNKPGAQSLFKANPLLKWEKECIHHQDNLVFYCESCEEPICKQCTVIGPHNNQLHRVNTLGEAFESRALATHQVVSGSLLKKRDRLITQVHKIDHRSEEIKHVKSILDRDARTEYEGMLDRLKAAEGVKLAVLQHDIANLQRDVDKISDIINAVNDLTGEAGDPIDFLLRYRHLIDTIEFTVAKPFKTVIQPTPYDLPRELALQREKLEKMRVVQDILEMKDHVIFELINNYNQEEVKITAHMNKATHEEIEEWVKLTDKFAGELRKYHILCYYCGCTLEERNVNQYCDTNSRTVLPEKFGFTIEAPDRTLNGTRRHYFAKPKPELVQTGRITSTGIPDLQYVTRNEKDQITYKSQFHMFLEVLLAKVRKYCTEKEIKVEQLFKDHDKNKTEKINHIAFTFILHEFCAVDMIEIEKLKNILDPQNKNEIAYMELVKMIKDPKYLSIFHKP